jgi:predicted component of type VI protein secretion system
MICGYCATELPSDAMFCGECGRAVISSAPGVRTMIPSPLTRPVAEPEPWSSAAAGAAAGGMTCDQCGAPLSPDDIFCGECGFVVNAIGRTPARPRDTNVVERLEQVEQDGPEPQPEPQSEPEPEPQPELEPEPEPEPAPEPAAEAAPESFEEDVEPTRIVSPHQSGERFVLQFSTGESFTVFGTGLIGRNPRPEPGEYFDDLVRVLDPSRSVSKTHLEFGQEAGAFWVKDRYSGNGTIVREPDSKPLRCHPERRYRLVRGSRVDLGEQFFIVS